MALLYLLLLLVALQSRPLHAAPLQAWGAEELQGFLEHPPFPLDFGVETEPMMYPERMPGGQGHPASQVPSSTEAPAEGTVSDVPLERIPLDPHLPLPLQPRWYQSRHHLHHPLPPRGHGRGPPSGKYSGEGAKKLAESLETMKKLLEDLERGQGVASKGTRNADGLSNMRRWCPGSVRQGCMVAAAVLVLLVPVSILLCCVLARWQRSRKRQANFSGYSVPNSWTYR